MKQLRKFRSKYRFAGIVTALIFFTLTWKTAWCDAKTGNFYSYLTPQQDTIKPQVRKIDSTGRGATDTISAFRRSDTTKPSNRIDSFSVKISKDTLEAPVFYEAKDSAVVLIRDKKILLYGKTKTDYKNITLTAPRVEVDQQTQILTAFNRLDSLGDVVERAKFKEGENGFESDTIRFDFKTQKGITKNTFTIQNGVVINSRVAKKVNSSTMYARNGTMSTCDYDDPHFGFHYNKLKIVNDKIAVSGLIYPEFEGVPIPIALPFGIFPLNKHRHSGFLPPQFTSNEKYGLGLEGLGWYQVLNDYWDVTLRGNIYSYGGWMAAVTPSYRRRYKYNGALNLSVQSTKENFKGDPDYYHNMSYFINWNHSVDSKARPGTTFSANVSAGSTTYNRNIPNSPARNFQNQMQSSITYSKIGDLGWFGEWWRDKPYSLTLSANHNQNDVLHYIQVGLPDVGFTVNSFYPFQKLQIVGSPKWYEKLSVGYNGTFRSQFSFYDTAFSFKQIIDTLQWGAQHSVPISLTLPPILGGALIVSPGVAYQQNWLSQTMHRTWNPAAGKTDTLVTKGFFMDQSASFSLGISTTVYGRYDFKSGTAIRHVMRPTIALGYKPDLSRQHFYNVQIDTFGHNYRFSEFEGTIFGGFSEGKYGGISFTLDNNLEMKKPKKDSADEDKRIKILDGFGFTSSYNLMADSFALAPFNLYARTTLFDKIQISANAILNPYDYDQQGFPVNKLFEHNGKPYAGRITNGNLSVSTEFKSKPKDPNLADQRKKQMNEILNDPAMIDRQNLMDYMKQRPGDFVDFNIPWTLGLSLSVYYTTQLKPNLTGFDKKFNASLNFNGSFNLTPKWNFGVSSGYFDLNAMELQSLQLNVSRDMHCWQMTIGVVPIGLYRSFSINISPKASVLQDIKINRTRFFSDF